MANMIRMTPEELDGYVREFHSCANSLLARRMQIMTMLNELKCGWSGDEMDEHIEKINRDMTSVEVLCEDLVSLAGLIEQAALAVQQSENMITSTFDSFI